MPRTLATGTRPRPETGRPRSAERGGGFTLVEVLAVVAITGLILAIAVVNLFPDDAQLSRREAANLALDIEYARDAAWFGGLPTAVTLSEGRVRKWRLQGDSWRAEASRDRRLEGEVRVTAVHVDGQALSPDERLVFLPDGLGTPFHIALQVRGRRWGIEGDASGSVRLVEP